MTKTSKYLDPAKLIKQVAGRESNKERLDALAEELWRVVQGPSGLADTIGEMMQSFRDSDRVGHQSQIRLVSDVVRILERSADGETLAGADDEEDLKAEFDRLQREFAQEDDEEYDGD